MAARDLLTVLLRALGIYFVVLNGAKLPGTLYTGISTLSSGFFQQMGMAEAMISSLVQVPLGFLLGLLLVWLAPRMAARLCPAPEPASSHGTTFELTGGVLLRSGLQVLGVYIFYQALRWLAAIIVPVFQMSERQTFTDLVASDGMAGDLAMLAACAVAGWVLVFRGHAVSAWLERLSPAAGANARGRGESEEN
jgi:hypothetical protein